MTPPSRSEPRDPRALRVCESTVRSCSNHAEAQAPAEPIPWRVLSTCYRRRRAGINEERESRTTPRSCPEDERERAVEIVSVEDRLVDVIDAEFGRRFPGMANWGPEVEWHERDVVVPAFRQWLEAQGWETETETEFVDVVAHRGNETIYAEVKGRTHSRPGGGTGLAIRPVAEANACRGRRRPQHEVCGRDPDRCGSGRPPGPETSPGPSADRRLRSERGWPGREAG
jgi:hypothetical protein